MLAISTFYSLSQKRKRKLVTYKTEVAFVLNFMTLSLWKCLYSKGVYLRSLTRKSNRLRLCQNVEHLSGQRIFGLWHWLTVSTWFAGICSKFRIDTEIKSKLNSKPGHIFAAFSTSMATNSDVISSLCCSLLNAWLVFSKRALSASIGNLSNDDGDPKDDPWSKMNLYFISEIRDRLDLFSTPLALQTCSG